MPKRRPDHIPTRTCAVCRTSRPKREMTRIVRTVDGSVHVDESGRVPGRGTYVCNQPGCRDADRRAVAITRALGAEPRPGALDFEVNDAAK
jgi:predicted RNA-binding protein YlxR (DUF448 family)